MATPTGGTPASSLERGIGLVDAAAIVVGSMIGSGIFITSAESARLVGAPGWLLLAWVVAGLLTVCGALCCGEVAAMMPRAGGQYVFLREAYGRPVGFLFGWALFLVVQTGTIAAVAVAFSKFLGVFLPAVAESHYLIAPRRFGGVLSGYAISLSTQQLVAVGLIVLLTAVNTRGLRLGTLIQNSFTATKTLALGGLIVVGLFGINRAAAAFTSNWWNPAANGWTIEQADPRGELAALGVAGAVGFAMIFGKALVGPLFSQTAWNNVTFTGEETRDPGRVLPRALLLGTSTVVVLYVLANLAYVAVLPLPAIQGAPQDRVGTATMRAVLGRPGEFLMAAAILISTAGCVNGLVLAGARVLFAMARDGLFFRRLATTNARHVPGAALVAQGAWAALLTLPRTVATDPKTGEVTFGNVYGQLLEYIVSADLFFYMLMIGAVVVLRVRRPDAKRPFRTPLYPLPVIVYLVLSGLIVLDLLVVAPKTSGIGFLLVLTGIPVYLGWLAFGRTTTASPAPPGASSP